jgi:hypothetical protein
LKTDSRLLLLIPFQARSRRLFLFLEKNSRAVLRSIVDRTFIF